MKLLLLPILLLPIITASAQPSDFIVLKKRNQTVRNYFAGSQINFTTVNGGSFEAQVERISKDTLHVVEFIIARVPTRLGVYVLDTVARYHYRFHYKEIRSVYADKRGFNYRNSGYTLMGGAALITLGTGVSYLVDRKKTSVPLLVSGLGHGVAGYFLTRVQTTTYTIGKKYTLKYISTNPG